MIHVITWETHNHKWYLESWLENPDIFKWCKCITNAQGFETDDLAMEFAIERLEPRKVEFEKVEYEDFGIVFDL